MAAPLGTRPTETRKERGRRARRRGYAIRAWQSVVGHEPRGRKRTTRRSGATLGCSEVADAAKGGCWRRVASRLGPSTQVVTVAVDACADPWSFLDAGAAASRQATRLTAVGVVVSEGRIEVAGGLRGRACVDGGRPASRRRGAAQCRDGMAGAGARSGPCSPRIRADEVGAATVVPNMSSASPRRGERAVRRALSRRGRVRWAVLQVS